MSLVLGDITAGQMRALAVLSRAYGDGMVRVTVDQNLVMRWVEVDRFPACIEGLRPRVWLYRVRARSPT